jgi:small-conductance mechanosensitive channel
LAAALPSYLRPGDPAGGVIQGELYRSILVWFREHQVVMPSPGREIIINKVPPIAVSRMDDA